jgi:hypothetical protein
MKFRIFLALGITAFCVALSLWFFARPVEEAYSRPGIPSSASLQDRGIAAFMGAGFGGISVDALETNAIPWRIAAAALVLEHQRQNPTAPTSTATLRAILQQFGFLFPDEIGNLPKGMASSKSGMPLGMTWGEIAPVGGSKVMVANMGCAACHAGVTYADNGNPQTNRVMLGTPNSSLNLEAYTQAIYVAMRRHANSTRLIETAQILFPEMGWRERQSLRFLVLPLARSRLKDLEALKRPTPFPNGSPGNTNGVAALKSALSTPLLDGGPGDKGNVSIPALGDRVWRKALLADGAYRIPGHAHGEATVAADISAKHLAALATITSFFTVPSMGVHPDDAIRKSDDANAIFAWLKSYQPQAFPGAINIAKARRGAMTYEQNCASCHGDYAWDTEKPKLVRFPNWLGDIGTDGLRSIAFDRKLADAVDKTAYRGKIAVQIGKGYAAPPLSGLWSSAPYLHNGSVPSLWALLSPEQRPVKFMVGGHALDYKAVGLRLQADGGYPAGYQPFSKPYWYDTDIKGQGNQGHMQGATLRAADKEALIEFLKLL